MDISIIICAYNRKDLLKKTLDSIAAFELPDGLSWEVLVVDNNSVDGTKDFILGYIKTAKIPIKYIFESAQGKSVALNKGITESKGEIVAFLDDDIQVDRNWLKEVLEATNKYPDIIGFGGKELLNWPVSKPSWVVEKGAYENIIGTIGGYRDCGNSNADFEKLGSLPTGGNMFFRKKIFDEGNYFREDLGPVGQNMGYGEDSEFCQRLIGKGEKLFYINNAIVYHNIPPEKISKKYFCKRRFDSAKNEIKYRKNLTNIPFLFGVPRYLFAYLIISLLKGGFSIGSARRFHYKLKVCSILGQIAGYRKVAKS